MGRVQPVQTTAPGAVGPMPVSAVIPAGYQEPAESAPIQPPTATGGDENARAGSISTADPFHRIQDRLRQLGATYYLLESWGNQQQMYRFYCKMAIGGSADYTRCFEATNSNPLQAMRQVLQQVETQAAMENAERTRLQVRNVRNRSRIPGLHFLDSSAFASFLRPPVLQKPGCLLRLTPMRRSFLGVGHRLGSVAMRYCHPCAVGVRVARHGRG